MRLLELSTQATVGFSPRTQTTLAQGYNLLVPPTPRPAPLPELLSALFYNDGRGGDAALAAAQGACALLVLQGPGGVTYRLARQLGGRGALHQLDAPGQPWREICRDARDITSVLRSSCGLPTKGQFESIFCFSPRFKPPVLERGPSAPFGGGLRFGAVAGSGPGGGGLGNGAACFGTGAPSGFGGFGGASGLSGLSGQRPQPSSLMSAGSTRPLSTPGRSLQMQQQAALPPPLPLEEAQAIREKLLAEIAAGKALDEWQFELEGLQQKVFLHREKMAAREQLAARVATCEAELTALGPALEERGVEGWLIERAINYDGALKRRDAGLKDLRDEAHKLGEQRTAVDTKPPWKRPELLASALAGVLCLAVGIAFYGSPVGLAALAAIAAFGYPAFCALGWLDEAELRRGLAQRAQRLRESEQKLVDSFERDFGPVEGALRALGLSSGQEVQADRERRAALTAALEQARRALAEFEAEPGFQQSQREDEQLQEKIAALEQKIEKVALQATRDHHVAESELKALEARQSQPLAAAPRAADESPLVASTVSGGITAASPPPPGASDNSDERIPALLKLALDLWPGSRLDTVGPALQDRVGQYWAALTQRPDRRVEFNGRAEAAVLGGGGASLALPAGDERELLYWAVRLALLEKLVTARPIPIVMEEPCAGWTEPRAQLFTKALQHLSAATQVFHVSALAVHRGLSRDFFPL